MIILRKVVLFILMTILVLWANAQVGLDFYSLENQFNASDYNPAFLSSQNNFTFSMFPVGGTSIGYNNQQVVRQLLSKVVSGASTDQDFKDMLKSMEDHSSIHQAFESVLFTVTYPSTLGVFNFRIKEVENFSAILKGDLTDFIFRDGIQSASVNQVQRLPAQAMHYREYSIGYSKATRNNRLAVGIRAKMYFGKAAFFSGISGVITSNPAGDYVVTTEGLSRLSFPMTKINVNGTITEAVSGFNTSKTIKYLMNTGNPGLGVDLGLNYRISPELAFSLSVIDLGEISWKTNLNSKSFATRPGEYILPGGSYVAVNGNGDPVITKTGSASYIESVSNIFELTPDSSAFSRPMPVNVFTGLKYQVNPSLKISIVDRYVLLSGLNYNSFSLAASIELNKGLSVSTGYSIIGDSYKNIPCAVLFKRNFGQVYLGTENLLAIVLPSLSDFAGFSFGACFYLFKNRNLSRKVSADYPFYSPRRSIKSRKTGLIEYNYPEF